MKRKVSVAIVPILAFVACDGNHAPRAAEVAPIDAVATSVRAVEWPSSVEVGGIVRATLTAAVSSRIAAPVLAVHVSAGDSIRRGQPLVTLDARELRANLNRAEAALAAARESSAAAAANVDAADAALTLARASHDRIRALHGTRSATPQELDDAVAGLSGATARAAAARAQAAAATAAVAAATAASQSLQIGLSYAVLTAPFDGLVSNRSVDPGSLAMPGVELLAVESAGGHRLEVQVDESRRSQVAVGDAAHVRVDAEPASPWLATRIEEIASVDPRQHSFRIKLPLPLPTGARSGTFGRARLFGPVRLTLAAAATSLTRRGQLWFVFAIDNQQTARLRLVTPGELRGHDIEVLSGVTAGDRLIADPAPAMQDGTRVRIRATGARQDGTGSDR